MGSFCNKLPQAKGKSDQRPVNFATGGGTLLAKQCENFAIVPLDAPLLEKILVDLLDMEVSSTLHPTLWRSIVSGHRRSTQSVCSGVLRCRSRTGKRSMSSRIDPLLPC